MTITVTDVDENVAPEFATATITRSVAENTAAGVDIGDPVEATDDADDHADLHVGAAKTQRRSILTRPPARS